MPRLAFRLVVRALLRSPVASALSLLVIATASAVILIAISLQRSSSDPWERTFRAANGPHIVMASMGDAPQIATTVSDIEGISARDEIRRTHILGLDLETGVYGALATATTSDLPEIDRPLVVAGRWLRGSGEAVLERTYAAHHEVRIGDTVTLQARESVPVKVVGIATILTREPYPQSQPGSLFATAETLQDAGVGPPMQTSLAIRLEDPESAENVADRLRLTTGVGSSVTTWHDLRADALAEIKPLQAILSSFAVLLLVGSALVLLLNMGARVLVRGRDLSTLKAVGMTPLSLTATLIAENVVLGALGAVFGIVVGAALLPKFTALTATALAAAEPPAATLPHALITLSTCVLMSAGIAWSVARRIARVSVAHLAVESGQREVPSKLAGFLARFGAGAQIGGAQAFAQRRRALLALLAMVLTSMTIVSALAMESTFDRADGARTDIAGEMGPPPGSEESVVPAFEVVPPRGDETQIRTLVYTLGAALTLIALVNLVGTALLDMRERVAQIGVLKAIGMTPAQVSSAFLVSGALIAAVAAVVGIPLGLAFFKVVYQAADGSAETIGWPSATRLLLFIPLLTAFGASAISGVAFYASRIRPHVALAYE